MQRSAILVVAFVLAACGKGSGPQEASHTDGYAPPSAGRDHDVGDVVLTKAHAFRFLNQATFGATEDEAEKLIRLGIETWIDDQMAQPVSLQLPHLEALPRPNPRGRLQPDRINIWFRNALHGPDQLRQRVAFALSEIFVVSQVGALQNAPYALASYYDLLAKHAFGNYRDLLESVTLHPAMGAYLSTLGNRRADIAANIRPDENYARELLQLFTIGLVELETDGTPKLDHEGSPFETYNQQAIEELARVFTGWHYAGSRDFMRAKRTDENQTVPMHLYQAYHDTAPKKLFSGTELGRDQPGQIDLANALDEIFHHSNVGPFIAHRLIQRLVSSNPSHGYIERVAETFNDNGFGVRGDLGAVVKAILLDPEARPEPPTDASGKLKEPLLRLTQLWRAYNAASPDGIYRIPDLDKQVGQGPLQAPSVFNFFSPSYSPPGELSDRGLVSPELELATEFLVTRFANLILGQIFYRHTLAEGLAAQDVLIDIEEEISLADNPEALVDRVAEKLLGGDISPELRTEILALVEQISPEQVEQRAEEAIYFIATSPEFAVQQ